jgi:hypothetical protein
MDIEGIRGKILEGDYKFSEHAIKRMIERKIQRNEIEEVIFSGEVIEEYPDDKYSPSCLIYGKTDLSRKLHIQVSLPPKIVIITAYEPDIEK